MIWLVAQACDELMMARVLFRYRDKLAEVSQNKLFSKWRRIIKSVNKLQHIDNNAELVDNLRKCMAEIVKRVGSHYAIDFPLSIVSFSLDVAVGIASITRNGGRHTKYIREMMEASSIDTIVELIQYIAIHADDIKVVNIRSVEICDLYRAIRNKID